MAATGVCFGLDEVGEGYGRGEKVEGGVRVRGVVGVDGGVVVFDPIFEVVELGHGIFFSARRKVGTGLREAVFPTSSLDRECDFHAERGAKRVCSPGANRRPSNRWFAILSMMRSIPPERKCCLEGLFNELHSRLHCFSLSALQTPVGTGLPSPSSQPQPAISRCTRHLSNSVSAP